MVLRSVVKLQQVEEGKWWMGPFFARADFSLFSHQRGRSLVVPGYISSVDRMVLRSVVKLRQVEEGKWLMGSFFAWADFSLFSHQRGRSLVVPGYKLSWSNGAALSCETPTNKLKLTIVISSLLFVWVLLLKRQKWKTSDNIALFSYSVIICGPSLVFLKRLFCAKVIT